MDSEKQAPPAYQELDPVNQQPPLPPRPQAQYRSAQYAAAPQALPQGQQQPTFEHYGPQSTHQDQTIYDQEYHGNPAATPQGQYQGGLEPYPPPPNQQSQSPSTLGGYAPPPKRYSASPVLGPDDPSNPIYYARDPHRLVAYLVSFPKPHVKGVPIDSIPPRFLIYTPPPPPLKAPQEGEKEAMFHKVQRKWQEEVRAAKTSDAKTMSWNGLRSKATRGISTAMGYTMSSNLEFLNRIDPGSSKDKHAEEDGHSEDEKTHKTVSLEAMTLVYPSSTNMPAEKLKQEFIDTMLRSKSKAQRDAILATGLLPVSAAIDILATVVWPFGGLLEIDGVWLYASLRGAKTSHSVTKRLTSSSHSGDPDKDQLKLEFTASPQLDILDRYLAARCHERDPKMFPSAGVPPTGTEVLEAIGWAPSQTGGEQRNWEDEQWEMIEVKDDLKSVMSKGAREWDKWVREFEKNPEKAMKK